MRHNLPKQQQGLTLVELMIALTLGLIVITAIIAVFLATSQNYRQNEAIATVQDNARFALDSITRDLAMAGYWGGVRTADAGKNVGISTAALGVVTDDCRPAGAPNTWLFDTATPIVFHDHLAGVAAAAAQFTCLDSSQLVADSDVLMIRRTSGAEAFNTNEIGTVTPTGATTTANRFYLKTNQSVGSLFRAGSSFNVSNPTDCPGSVCPPVSNPVQVYAYTPQLYYVRNYLKTPGDGLPVLCRRYLDDTTGTPTMLEDCLAEGVEMIQLEWGIENSDALNYTPTPSAAELFNARTVRVHVLVRATGKNVQASNDAKSYVLANYSGTRATGVLRRAFSTTIELKNLQP